MGAPGCAEDSRPKPKTCWDALQAAGIRTGAGVWAGAGLWVGCSYRILVEVVGVLEVVEVDREGAYY